MRWKNTFTVCVAFLLWASFAHAASVTVAWDANPPAEQVTGYTLYEGTKALWTGPGTTATVDLTPGPHTLEVTAKNPWGESPRSEPVSTPGGATAPKGVVITITITVQ